MCGVYVCVYVRVRVHLGDTRTQNHTRMHTCTYKSYIYAPAVAAANAARAAGVTVFGMPPACVPWLFCKAHTRHGLMEGVVVVLPVVVFEKGSVGSKQERGNQSRNFAA